MKTAAFVGSLLLLIGNALVAAEPLAVPAAPMPDTDGSLSEALLDDAWTLMREKKDHVGALKKIDDALTFIPAQARTFLDAGFQAQAAGHPEEAAAAFERARQAFRALPDIFAVTGHVRRKAGDLYGALSAYDTALLIAPRYGFAMTGRAETKYDLEDYEGAIADFTTSLQFPDRNGIERVYLRRGAAYLALGENDKAEADFREAIRLAPDYQTPHILLGRILRQQAHWSEALRSYNKALEITPDDPRAYNGRMWVRYQMGDPELALADINKCIALAPTDGHYPLYRALLYRLLGKFDLADADFRRAVELANAAKDTETWFYASSHRDLMQRLRGVAGADEYLQDVLSWTDSWEKRLGLYLAGKIPDTTLLNDARQAKRLIDRRQQECEACYYAGVVALVNHQRDAAIGWFRQCLATAQIEMAEYDLALTQLKDLGVR